jgi:hypothetical protein
MLLPGKALIAAAAAVALATAHLLAAPPRAVASAGQVAIIEDDPHLLAHPERTMFTFRALGAQTVRLFVRWSSIAPNWHSTREPARFNATNPAAYLAYRIPADASVTAALKRSVWPTSQLVMKPP